MKRILEVVNYLMKCAHAVSEGVKVAHAHWPVDSPFTNEGGTNANG